ncbi:MAG: diguanylate cyclase [Deltaproteobacteria bacterium]|nr:diguanylate cyclase [Deltaproteobacteria bacterium]
MPFEKILIIDDDNLTSVMVEAMLRSYDFQTRRAPNGTKGIEAARQWRPDLILLDIVMPDVDGLTVCEAIRGVEFSQRPSVIITSSKGDKKMIAEALHRGADDFIVKPADELELIARISAQLRIAGLLKESEEDRRNTETILAITEAMGTTLDSTEILDIIVKKVAECVGAVRCSIVLLKTRDEGYVLVSHEDPKVRDLKIDLKKYPEILEVIRTKTPLVVEDMASHPLMNPVREWIRKLEFMSVLVIPIVFNEKVLGTLFLRARRKDRGFTGKEVEFCRIIANSSYHALKNAKLFEEATKEKNRLGELATRDPLTSLYNHNFFYTRLEEEVERAMRYSTHLSLIMMDVDDFKRINDTYGHRTGDRVLKEVAALIQKSVRKVDMVARYGGEEFAVVMPQTPLDGASEEAERIRRLISGHSYGDVENGGLRDEEITVSLGVAAYPHKKIESAGDLVNQADRALYEAKNSGKNCVRKMSLKGNSL